MMADGPPEVGVAQKTPRRHPFVPLWLVRRSDIIIPLAMLSVVLAAVAVGIVLWRTDNLDLGTAGFAGVWIISFIGAAYRCPGWRPSVSLLRPVLGSTPWRLASSPVRLRRSAR